MLRDKVAVLLVLCFTYASFLLVHGLLLKERNLKKKFLLEFEGKEFPDLDPSKFPSLNVFHLILLPLFFSPSPFIISYIVLNSHTLMSKSYSTHLTFNL